jgi:NADP-dependent 3-hydroxy acid dehydrogenase YdfG
METHSPIVLITGATSGIGLAAAKKFAQAGYRLVLLARRIERLRALKVVLEDEHGIEAQILVADVRNRTQLETALNSLPENWYCPDVLINNAGLALGLGTIDQGNPDDWDVMVDTNIKGLLYVTSIISKRMVSKEKGHIINIASIAGKEVYPNGNVYCATKFAVDALSRAMRIDLLHAGIKVTNIAPGMVETEFSLVRFKGDAQRAEQTYKG